MTDDCLFCKIANREIPAKIIYEDDQLLVFEDVNPQAPFHVLIIPRRHISTLNEVQGRDVALMGRSGRRRQGSTLDGSCSSHAAAHPRPGTVAHERSPSPDGNTCSLLAPWPGAAWERARS